jgi:hypothetical protein
VAGMGYRVLTWHVHGNYLYYLCSAPHTFLVPTKPGRPEGYGGRKGHLPWPDNLEEFPAERAADSDFDCILFQSKRNWDVDQYELLTDRQRRLPRVYVEHDPPRENPTDTRHHVDDPETLLVHVTPFNDLMWDNGATPTRVVEHGVKVPPEARYTGELDRGIAVVNGMAWRGRRVGRDILDRVRETVPVDLVGMGSQEIGGLGEIPNHELHSFISRYRFFFNPIRYTSLGLAVCEAMTLGMPIVGLATTEMPTTVQNGVSGYIDTDVDKLIGHMRSLLDDRSEALRLSEGASRYAQERFAIGRFAADWDGAIRRAVGGRLASRARSS